MRSKYDGSQLVELNVTRLVKLWNKKPSLRDKVGLGLFIDLRAMREHTKTHRDGSSLSSLKEWGTLDILRIRVFL